MQIILQILVLENQKIIGSTYEYYVKGLDGDREFTSDTKSATITTGVKKYRYSVNDIDSNNIDKTADGLWTEVNSTEDIEKIKLNSSGRYLHIYSIDGAGNESDTTKIELVPQTQNIDVTKEVVNPKNEYKIGDIVTYSIKFKIRENENNKASVHEVSVEDIFEEGLFEYLSDTLWKNDSNLSVIKEQGKLKISLSGMLNYGSIKEIRYGMRITNNANGKSVNNTVNIAGISTKNNNVVGSSASKNIIVNDPKIDIQKSVDKLEYKVGDEVIYKVKIKSLVPGTTITNVNIKEVIPKGLDLKEDSGKISINGTEIANGLVKTVADGKTSVSAGITTINRK